MTDYTKLVEALRGMDIGDSCPCEYYMMCEDSDCVLVQAAAAIEALQAQLPKRGEWLPYEFNANGIWHKCSVCGVAYQYKDAPNSGWWINHKYCPNCGAKMEVQDG